MGRKVSQNLELFFWFLALLGSAVLPMPENGFSFCPLHLMGFRFCPGCGLGKAMHLAFHGEFSESFSMHPLGIPAILIIFHRTVQIAKHNFFKSTDNAKCQSHTASISL